MKKTDLNRRDFLKIAGASATIGISNLLESLGQNRTSEDTTSPNILILVLDALSARNISLFGYSRETMPNLEKFAEKATIFHQHHSAANFTNPSTASLLTGTYPWENRGINFDGLLDPDFENKNIFSIVPQNYTKFGYTQNSKVERMMLQCERWIDSHPNMQSGSFFNKRILTYKNDNLSSFWGERIIRGEFSTYKPAFYLGTLIDLIQEALYNQKKSYLQDQYPYDLPVNQEGIAIDLPGSFDWLFRALQQTPSPFLAYVHLYPPHDPYRPSLEFINHFIDSPPPPAKPAHIFSDPDSQEDIPFQRLLYDQFIADVDNQLGNFLTILETTGLMKNTVLIITSDHGEMFERGILGHSTRVMYEPLLHVPLVIHKPGQNVREDVYTPTNHIDILPTICQITGAPILDWIDGEILPTFTDKTAESERAIFSLEAKENSKFKALTIGTAVMIEWPYKLIYYFGYEELPKGFELYNLEDDPEELKDLYIQNPEIAEQMKRSIVTKIEEVNEPFQHAP